MYLPLPSRRQTTYPVVRRLGKRDDRRIRREREAMVTGPLAEGDHRGGDDGGAGGPGRVRRGARRDGRGSTSLPRLRWAVAVARASRARAAARARSRAGR